jgi:phosphoenolpyruvate---glycerone phosphotransferase subunit DhaL
MSNIGHGTMDTALQRRLIEAVAAAMIDHAEELTGLDRAIGDGDHGLNMKRGFEAVMGDIDGLAARTLPEALRAIGTQLVMKVGGASGPLYGTLFLTLGKELPADPEPADATRALGAAIAAVMARGKSQPGQKTMLDVLAPIHAELLAGSADLATRVRARAAAAAEATVPMKALRGRASFLGERSIGHMDPGARSASLMVAAVCEVLGEDPCRT